MPKAPQATPVFHIALRWSVSHNPDNLETLRTWCRANADKWVFQAEDTGANPHYQGYIHVAKKVRPKSLAKEANDTLIGVELQAASTAGVASLKKYCMKRDTRVDGPWADKRIYMGGDLWEPAQQPNWQKQHFAHYLTDPDDRKLMWIYDPVGNNGKSKYLKWLSFRHSSLMLGYGHAADLLNLVSKFPGRRHYGFNQTRSKPHNLQEVDMYSAMESIKDGHFINLKYETNEVLMDPPHVTCFSNHLPQVNHVSLDRWLIFKITDNNLVLINSKGEPIQDHVDLTPEPDPFGDEFERHEEFSQEVQDILDSDLHDLPPFEREETDPHYRQLTQASSPEILPEDHYSDFNESQANFNARMASMTGEDGNTYT